MDCKLNKKILKDSIPYENLLKIFKIESKKNVFLNFMKSNKNTYNIKRKDKLLSKNFIKRAPYTPFAYQISIQLIAIIICEFFNNSFWLSFFEMSIQLI